MHEWFSGDADANGVRIRYYRTGADKPRLVLSHGVTDSGLWWTPVARALRRPLHGRRHDAATLWYHSHEMGLSRTQVTRGLASMFILDDANPAQLELPHTYGVDDIRLILQASPLEAARRW